MAGGLSASQHAARLIDSLDIQWDPSSSRAAVVSRNPDLLHRRLMVDLDRPGQADFEPATRPRYPMQQQPAAQPTPPPPVFMVPAGRATGGRAAQVTPPSDARPLAPVVCTTGVDPEAGRRFAPRYYAAPNERPVCE